MIPALFIFLLKVNIALVIFCLGYYLVLRKLTFYILNRVYLGLGIIFSSTYPLINVDSFLKRHQQLAIPVQRVAINWQAPAVKLVEQPAYWYWITVLFWAGVVLFAARLLLQLLSLYKLYRNSTPGTIHEHRVRITKANISPFSFWQNIYINPDNIEAIDLQSILQHEQVHVKEWHTLDILLAELSVIFYWFNPGVWLIKKAVRENVEFITDRKILQKGMDSKAYQYSLLHVSIAETTSAGITNHFNFSTLKKRIKMMNAKKSSNLNLTRYAFLVPGVLVCLFVFNITKAEIVKTGKVVYKQVAASVNKLTADTAKFAATEMRIEAPDTPKKTKTKYMVFTTKPDTVKIKSIVFSVSKHGDSSAYIVNGKKMSEAEFKKLESNFKTIPASDLEQIRVIDDNTNINTSGNLNNVVVLKRASKDSTQKHMNVAFSYRISSDKDKDSPTVTDVVLTPPPSQTDFNNKLIIINGKEAGAKELKKLSAADIETVTPFDGNEQDSSDGQPYFKKYGDKAKNGVVVITTKKSK